MDATEANRKLCEIVRNNFTNDEQKDAISKVNKGDKIVVYGKIISMVESNSMSVLEMELIKIA